MNNSTAALYTRVARADQYDMPLLQEQIEALRAADVNVESIPAAFEAALARDMDSLADLIFIDTDKYRALINQPNSN